MCSIILYFPNEDELIPKINNLYYTVPVCPNEDELKPKLNNLVLSRHSNIISDDFFCQFHGGHQLRHLNLCHAKILTTILVTLYISF
jgi:hypothetical protein